MSRSAEARARPPGPAAARRARREQPAAEPAAGAGRRPGPARLLAFAALCVVCLLVAIGYAWPAIARSRAATASAPSGPGAMPAGAPQLIYVRTDGGFWEGAARLPLPVAGAEPQLLGLQCQRVHVAAGQGICLQDGALRGGAYLFGPDFKVRHRLPIGGITSRARVAPDGRHAAMTVFVQGHSYSDGRFSTQTTLLDTASGASLGTLEDFTVLRDGAPFRSEDFNFWGVTFARDGNRFFATLATGGRTYLVEGDLAARQLRMLRENVECPSLSPDDARIAFKKRVDDGRGPPVWQLHVLELATGAERPIGERRTVDDQVEWLDDGQLLYSLRDEGPPATIRPDIWVAPLDGGPPRLLVTSALSPAVVR